MTPFFAEARAAQRRRHAGGIPRVSRHALWAPWDLDQALAALKRRVPSTPAQSTNTTATVAALRPQDEEEEENDGGNQSAHAPDIDAEDGGGGHDGVGLESDEENIITREISVPGSAQLSERAHDAHVPDEGGSEEMSLGHEQPDVELTEPAKDNDLYDFDNDTNLNLDHS